MFRAFIFAATMALCLPQVTGDERKFPNQIRFGTLEMNAEITRRYVFAWEGKEEVFSMDILGSSAIVFPGLPDLKEIGFRTAAGEIIKYNNIAKSLVIDRFLKTRSKGEIVGWIYRGFLDENLEIKNKGKTPVCRVDVLQGGEKMTLWKNLPEPAANEQRGDP